MAFVKPKIIMLNPSDNVALALEELTAGESLGIKEVTCRVNIPAGHKVAVVPIESGEAVQKYGAVVGCYRGIRRIFRCHPFHPGGYDPP